MEEQKTFESEDNIQVVPYFFVQRILKRNERKDIRHFVIDIVLVVALIASICAGFFAVHKTNEKWIDYISDYDFIEYSYSQDGQGVNIIGDHNEADYNGAEADCTQENP